MTKDNYGQYTDEELIQRLRNGETEISEYLLEKYKGIARTFAILCMERQMYNAIQVSNRQKHQPLNSYISLSEEFTEDNIFDQLVISNPESIIIDQETARDMEQRILKNLSPFEREVFTCYLQGSNYLQIAEMFHKSPKSIDNAIQRIRKKVRSIISTAFSQ